MIKKRIADKRVLDLIEKIIDSSYEKIEYENLFSRRKIGIPIGNLTSQLFANIYLNELDYFVKKKIGKNRYYLRYMDDFLFLNASKKKLLIIKNTVEDFLQNNLRLILHPKKQNIFPLKNGIDFLGYRFFYDFCRGQPQVKLRKSTVWRFIKRMKKFKEKKVCYDKVIQSVASWRGYAKHGDAFILRQCLRKKIINFKTNQ